MKLVLMLLFIISSLGAEARQVVVGSKKFTESVILGEILRQSLAHEDVKATHRAELGGTRILWNALLSGDIDAYVDYTGTISEEILKKPGLDLGSIKTLLETKGIGLFPPLGFNNTYAIGMKRPVADHYQISKISDLARHPRIKIGWGEEFRLRADGWPGLKKKYRLPQRFVRGLDHDIAYRALQSGDIEVTDLYTTDAEIAYYDLKILEDDLRFFPAYEAVILYRLDRATPAVQEAFSRLSGKITAASMIALNRKAKIDGRPASDLAADFLNDTFDWRTNYQAVTRAERILVRTREHVMLVTISLLLAIAIAVPLGILSEKRRLFGRIMLSAVGVIQTVPALALLVVLIRPLNWIGLKGIGDTPALIALILYSLLPILRSTHAGFRQIPASLREVAAVLGLSFFTRLFRIELPLALTSILSGIKTAAVMNVGFATLGALIGAGGYGQPILTGIRLDDYGLILEGALPAALMALLAQQLFDLIEHNLVSPGLR